MACRTSSGGRLLRQVAKGSWVAWHRQARVDRQQPADIRHQHAGASRGPQCSASPTRHTCMSNRLLVCSPSRVKSAAVASARSHCGQGGWQVPAGVANCYTIAGTCAVGSKLCLGAQMQPHAQQRMHQHAGSQHNKQKCSRITNKSAHVARPEQRLDRVTVEVAVGQVHAAGGVSQASRTLQVACGAVRVQGSGGPGGRVHVDSSACGPAVQALEQHAARVACTCGWPAAQ